MIYFSTVYDEDSSLNDILSDCNSFLSESVSLKKDLLMENSTLSEMDDAKATRIAESIVATFTRIINWIDITIKRILKFAKKFTRTIKTKSNQLDDLIAKNKDIITAVPSIKISGIYVDPYTGAPLLQTLSTDVSDSIRIAGELGHMVSTTRPVSLNQRKERLLTVQEPTISPKPYTIDTSVLLDINGDTVAASDTIDKLTDKVRKSLSEEKRVAQQGLALAKQNKNSREVEEYKNRLTDSTMRLDYVNTWSSVTIKRLTYSLKDAYTLLREVKLQYSRRGKN